MIRDPFFMVDRAAWETLRTLDCLSIRLYLELANMSDADGVSWPSVSTLATRLNAHRASIFRTLTALESLGLITRQSGRGCKTTNTYRIVAQAQPFSGLNGCAQATINPPNGRAGATRMVAPMRHRTRTIEQEPYKNAHSAKNGQAKIDQWFDQWWPFYPRKVSRKKARERFPKAIESIQKREGCDAQAALAFLIDRTKRYADSCDPQFLKHPDGWLYGERFFDELETAQSTGRPKV